MKKHCMKIVLLCLAVILFLSGISLAGATNPEIKSKPEIKPKEDAALPSLSFTKSDFVFSEVLEGSEILHEFTVQNKGTAILEIQKIRSG